MKRTLNAHTAILFALPMLLFVARSSVAQDAAVVDSTHYTVEFENDDVRVLRIKYGPGEESVMHSHPKSVVVSLSDASVTFTLPDGTMQEETMTSGQVISMPEVMHQPKNTGDTALEVIQIELKSDEEMMMEEKE